MWEFVQEGSFALQSEEEIVIEQKLFLEKLYEMNSYYVKIYSLTAFGKSIIPVLNAMCDWGTSYLDGLDIQPVCCPSQSIK